jgi:hypothetical protein
VYNRDNISKLKNKIFMLPKYKSCDIIIFKFVLISKKRVSFELLALLTYCNNSKN